MLDPADMHLDHADDGVGYRGYAHADCNLRAAGRKAHGLPDAPTAECPHHGPRCDNAAVHAKWSRRWHDNGPTDPRRRVS